ncbi:MAG TPA: hypothetical protein PKA87_10750, partial [Microthrixaceae bacterium]|nr:hypothetical protein [Microthrixaceae bacterium]
MSPGDDDARSVAGRGRLGGRSLAPVAGTFAAFGLFMGAWTVATPEVERALGGGPARLGLVMSAALVVASGVNTVGGTLAERRGTTAA